MGHVPCCEISPSGGSEHHIMCNVGDVHAYEAAVLEPLWTTYDHALQIAWPGSQQQQIVTPGILYMIGCRIEREGMGGAP